jgi:23S rRNA (uracil1939-C5)-methyltransferase
MREETLLRVERVGVRGDGVAHHRGVPVYLPFTAPGDLVRVVLGEGKGARVLAIETPAERAAPRCPHFGACGGCALQHLPDAVYAETKAAWLATALAQQGLGDVALEAPLLLPPGTRRRARFAMRRPRDPKAPAEIGFLARASHRVVDLRHCAVLDPALTALAQQLRAFAPRILAPGGKGTATATRAEAGVDLLLEFDDAPDLAGLEAFAEFAHGADLARLSWRNEGLAPVPVAERRPVRLTFGGIAVDLPPGVFLQASPEADAALAREVSAAVSGARHVADLYAGIGTFTLPLAASARVHAVDGAADAVAALGAAIRRAGHDGHVSLERRDLAARPLQPDELARFDAVVFDPPFAGARTQSAALARSTVPTIVAVSCNPATFARDARILVDGGYRLIAVQPVDSFLWSANLELVARFESRRIG